MRQNRRQEIKSRITHGALHVHTIKSIISLLLGPSCKLIKMVFQHIELMTPLRARKILSAGVLKPHLLSKMCRIGNNLHGEVVESSRSTHFVKVGAEQGTAGRVLHVGHGYCSPRGYFSPLFRL